MGGTTANLARGRKATTARSCWILTGTISRRARAARRLVVADLVERSRGHKKIILYAVPGKESFYRKFGFLRMKTAMAIFENQQQQLERGYLSEE